MTDVTRLELSDGSANKFWEVSTTGTQLRVRFGRIGSDGQTQLKTFPTPAAAKAAGDKLTAEKLKKGYAAAGKARGRVKPMKTSAEGPQALAVTKEFDNLGVVWQHGKEVWFAQADAESDEARALLKVGASIADLVGGDDGFVERWRFQSEADAKAAAKWMLAHAAKKTSFKGDTTAAIDDWKKRLKTERARLPRLEPGPGPVTMLVDTPHPWLYPRPPSQSFATDFHLAPVCSIAGPIDPRFGKRTHIYISACPTSQDQVFEIVVQDPAKPSKVDAYTMFNDELRTIHLTCQVSYDDGISWGVVEHRVPPDTNGHYKTTHVKNRAEAEKLFAAKLAEAYTVLPAAPKWYRGVLEKIAHHHRGAGQKPKKVSLRTAMPAMSQSVSASWCNPSRNVEAAYSVGYIGGTPRFCQEEWDTIPKNPCGKGEPLHIITFGDGDVGSSPILNDGGGGSLAVFAAPGDPFGTLTFSC
ncbi:MAG TPA: WGR domain-containing protein [Kofleriaceae bacterium]